MAEFCRDRGVELVVIGPEAPLVGGLADSLTAAGIECAPAAGFSPLLVCRSLSRAVFCLYILQLGLRCSAGSRWPGSGPILHL